MAVKCRALVLFFVFLTVGAAFAQDCPQSNPDGSGKPSSSQTLQGQLIYHDGLRKWFELRLDKPRCGQPSIQLIASDKNLVLFEVLRGCRVRSSGEIYESPTGYYSLDLSQGVSTIEAVGQCVKQKPFPDLSGLKPAEGVKQYRVEMTIDYGSSDHPIVFRVTSGGKELQPWQAYASYQLTGGLVLYGLCAKGFVVDEVSGPPGANPAHFTEARDPSDMAEFDGEGPPEGGGNIVHLGYTCVRSR